MSDQTLDACDGPSPAAVRGLGDRRARIDGARLNRLVFAGLFVVALLPVALTPIPAMVDYLNHLARMYVLAADGTANASPFYRVAWAFYPNLAMDLVVPRLARFIGVEAATRLFLLGSQVLVVTGAVAIEIAVKRRFVFAGYVALMLIYSVPFAWGFVNFVFALGLALWGIAGWLALRARPRALRFAVHAIFAVLLFVSHLFALGLYGVALGLHELWAARAGRVPLRAFAATVAMLAAPVLVLLAAMRMAGGSVGQEGNLWFFAMKPFWPLAVISGYSVVLSAICATAIGFALHALVRRRALRFEASGAWLLVGFGLLYLIVPSRMLDTAFVDLRVVVAAALIVPAFVTVSLPDPRWSRGLIGLMAGIVLANTAEAAMVFRSYDATYRGMIASFGLLDKGSRVLVAHSGASDDPPLRDLTDYPVYHAPTLAVHYAGAFVPTLFSTAGKQPISVRPEDRRLAASCTGPVPLAVLKRIASGGAAPDTPGFVRTWTRDFDYLYVVGDPVANPLPDLLRPIAGGARFAVYAVARHARDDSRGLQNKP